MSPNAGGGEGGCGVSANEYSCTQEPVWRIRDVNPGSRILIFTHPGSWFLPIPDPKTATKERGEKKNFVKHFFVATNFTKCKIILFLNCSRKRFGPNFKELWNFLPKKLSLRSQKYEFGIRDPGSGIAHKKIKIFIKSRFFCEGWKQGDAWW